MGREVLSGISGSCHALVRCDGRLTAPMITAELIMNRESVQNILVEDLGMRKVRDITVQKLLSVHRKKRCVTASRESLETITDDPEFSGQDGRRQSPRD